MNFTGILDRMQRPQQDDNLAVSVAVSSFHKNFVVEMCRGATPEDIRAWFAFRWNTNWACTFCTANNLKCTFQSPNNICCQNCAARGVTCSAKVDELYTRTKRKFGLDDTTFNILCQSTKEMRQNHLKRLLVDAPDNSNAATPVGIPAVTQMPNQHRQPQLGGLHIVALPPTPMSITQQVPFAPPSGAMPLPETGQSLSVTNTSDQTKAQVDSRQSLVSGGLGMVQEELYNESREEVRRLKEQLAASEAKNRELEESLKSAIDETELMTLTKTVKDLSESLADIKVKNRVLSQRVKELVSQDTQFIQKELLEHANIHVLIRLLALARADFAARKLSRVQMLQTLDNLSGQLHEVADRRLEKVPVGFGPIQEVMLPSRRHSPEVSDDIEVFDGKYVKKEEGLSSEPPPKRQKVSVSTGVEEVQDS